MLSTGCQAAGDPSEFVDGAEKHVVDSPRLPQEDSAPDRVLHHPQVPPLVFGDAHVGAAVPFQDKGLQGVVESLVVARVLTAVTKISALPLPLRSAVSTPRYSRRGVPAISASFVKRPWSF